MPRGQYTSGKGSSAVGLTAYVTRDPDTRQLVLQTYVLSSRCKKYFLKFFLKFLKTVCILYLVFSWEVFASVNL